MGLPWQIHKACPALLMNATCLGRCRVICQVSTSMLALDVCVDLLAVWLKRARTTSEWKREALP